MCNYVAYNRFNKLRFLQRVCIARNADRCNRHSDYVCPSVRPSVRSSVRPSFRHIPVFCPEEYTIVRFSASGKTIIPVTGEVKFIRYSQGITPDKGVKVRHYPVASKNLTVGHNVETVQAER